MDCETHRLTLLQAGTGYGKSTALATLAEEIHPLAWYHLAVEDADPVVFLRHLYYAIASVLPDFPETPLASLEEWERNRGEPLWADVVDALLDNLIDVGTSNLTLIIDDAHLLNSSAEALRILDRLIGKSPAFLHTVLASRYSLDLPSLITWRVRGEVLEIGQTELAFNQDETRALFRDHQGYELSQEEGILVAELVEGWPIALSLIRQRLLKDDEPSIPNIIGQLTGSSSQLFDYLAHEVLEQQPADIRAFLRITSVLREMNPEVCDQLRDSTDSAQILKYLVENDLFVVDLGNDHSRYHHLIRDLLIHQLTKKELEKFHSAAAAYYMRGGDYESSIFHLQEATAFEESAAVLSQIGRDQIRAGRLDTLQSWLGNLPPEVLVRHPSLLSFLGDIARLRSHFDEALRWYKQAEDLSKAAGDNQSLGQALRGQARIYLDIVDASKAEKFLLDALRLADGQQDRESKARLYELLAENMVNLGRFQESEAYRNQARMLKQEAPGSDELPIRLLLRTGRLHEARRILEENAKNEREQPVLRPRAHRETLLLLSLVLSFQGEIDEAKRTAVEGTKRGKQLKSSFITAVGLMREGHAFLTGKSSQDYQSALARFREAISLSDTLDVSRLKIEAYWGLTQAFGFQGDIDAALEVAEKGIDMALAVGDLWIEANIRLYVGASYFLAGEYDLAARWLSETSSAFRECGDTFGETNAVLWQTLLWQAAGDMTRLDRDVGTLLKLIRNHSYEFILMNKTLLGPPDPRTILPLLLFAREAGYDVPYINQLLLRLGLPDLEIHPGYQLRVKLLGTFELWLGDELVDRKAWSRKKALQLFQYLLTYRNKLIDREQITDMLWPELSPDDARRDFKVAYSALGRTIEPDRLRNAPSAFIIRDGSLYGIRPGADIDIDVDRYNKFIHQGDELFEEHVEDALPVYKQALALYRGDYLLECLYEEWCVEERERLQTKFLRVADRVAMTLAAQHAWEEVIQVCQDILAVDDCWEGAYRLMMRAYDQLGNRAQVIRTYQKCIGKLQSELGVEPAPATVELFKNLQ